MALALALASMGLMVFAAVAAIVLWAVSDYRAWKALGAGGLPFNFGGWLTTTRLRLRKADPISTAMYANPRSTAERTSFLVDIPQRCGPRPAIGRWPIPHRQLSQFMSTGLRLKLEDAFAAAVTQQAQLVQFKLSFFEKRNQAVTLCEMKCAHDDAQLSNGEIAHIHPSDGSMHMIFSPIDAAKVIELGWGERHPMSGVLPELPRTYIFVYPPRDEVELDAVEKMLAASIAYMTQRQGGGEGGRNQ